MLLCSVFHFFGIVPDSFLFFCISFDANGNQFSPHLFLSFAHGQQLESGQPVIEYLPLRQEDTALLSPAFAKLLAFVANLLLSFFKINQNVQLLTLAGFVIVYLG